MLDPNCLQRLSNEQGTKVDASRQRVKDEQGIE